MSTEPRPDPPDNQPDQHDDREIGLRSITILAGLFAGTTILVLGIAWVLTGFFSSTERPGDVPPPAIAAGAPTAPPDPRLEPSPPLDLAAFRAEEDAILNGYAWVDREHGIVSIPIDRAIDLVAERGLPSRRGAFPAASVTLPTPSSLRDRKVGSP